jgi:hypothetical protein
MAASQSQNGIRACSRSPFAFGEKSSQKIRQKRDFKQALRINVFMAHIKNLLIFQTSAIRII